MEIIHVPAPPKEAFNKHRRMSDLIKAQVSHLKHVEEKLPQASRNALPAHQIVTEHDAARYIAAMTNILRFGSNILVVPAKRVSEIRRAIPARPEERISLAAAEDKPEAVDDKRLPTKIKTSPALPKNKRASPKRKK